MSTETPEEVAQKVVDAANAESDPFLRAVLLATAGEYLAGRATASRKSTDSEANHG